MRPICTILLVLLFAGCNGQQTTTQSFTDRQKSELADFRNQNNVRGLAFALFTNDSTIWEQCLGKSSYGFPVNDSTLFNIQSVSKNFTALAVMLAIQDSLLDLYKPISAYLPDFRINSCYNDNPLEKITLSMLLSHTAGLTHEAPLGNNYDFTDCSFDQHIKSISDTWQKFPAGEGYSYSNLGVDLAAYIVEKTSGKTFDSYLHEKIFGPLGMKYTTIDDNRVVDNLNRTEGEIRATRTEHHKIPLMGSGAVYTNLTDFIRYAQLQMNHGKHSGGQLIAPELLNEMYTIRSRNYGLGTYIDKENDIWYINHNGGGFGYSATLVFFPEYNLGAVVMCNKPVNTFRFTIGILNEYIKNTGVAKDTLVTKEMNDLNAKYYSDPDLYNSFKPVHCSNDTLFRDEWNRYTGKYSMKFKNYDFRWYVRLLFSLGFFRENVYIIKANQTLVLEYNKANSILREYKPGLFFTNGGEAIDFRGPVPVFKNIELEKVRKH
jgi:CubicO group peptidase (beta-lactamase class C family)